MTTLDLWKGVNRLSKIDIKNKVFLAPMAGYTDQAFRIISFRQGVDISYSEMISAKAMKYKDRKTYEMLEISDEESTVGIQLFGSEPDILAEATKYLDSLEKVDIIDLNLGCPAPKIFKNNEGSSLLKDPSLIYKLLKSMRNATDKPLSAKMRIGIDNKNNYIEVARAIEESGVDFLIVHGRTRQEYYTGVADWDAIGNIKSKIKIPVVGNGDINLNTDIDNLLSTYKVDGLMIGRGAVGSPWIFNKIKSDLNNLDYFPLSVSEKFNIIYEHIDLICKLKEERIAIPEMRKHLHSYLKGMKDSSKLKNNINSIKTKNELKNILKAYELELLTSLY